jgi:hypothetical protein
MVSAPSTHGPISAVLICRLNMDTRPRPAPGPFPVTGRTLDRYRRDNCFFGLKKNPGAADEGEFHEALP